jgi:hypothetical protein
MPFDWLVSSIQSVISMINSENYFPNCLTEIDTSNSSCYKNYWKKHGCYFWHETKLLNEQNFETFKKKYIHITQNFNKISDLKNKIFVISNTQNNLSHINIQNSNFSIDLGNIRNLIKTINNKFDSQNKFILVLNENKIFEKSFVDDLENLASVYYLEQDTSTWEGDDCAWNLLFKSAFNKV